MINKDGGGGDNFSILWEGGHSCYEGGHRAHGGDPSVPPTRENPEPFSLVRGYIEVKIHKHEIW